MKVLLALSLLTIPGFGAWFSGEGKFTAPHDISFLSYATKEECVADQGRWEDGYCLFAAEDELSIARCGISGAYTVSVNTVTTNAHTCEFEGEGAFLANGTLRATAPSQVWNAERKEWVSGTCEVTVQFIDGDHASLSANDQCQSFCGMRATLDIPSAFWAK